MRVTVVKEELDAYPEFLVVYINSEQVLGPGVGGADGRLWVGNSL